LIMGRSLRDTPYTGVSSDQTTMIYRGRDPVVNG